MNVVINGKQEQLSDPITVAQLLLLLDLKEKKLAVEVNGDIIPRSLHGQHCLQNADVIEIVHAIGGG